MPAPHSFPAVTNTRHTLALLVLLDVGCPQFHLSIDIRDQCHQEQPLPQKIAAVNQKVTLYTLAN